MFKKKKQPIVSSQEYKCKHLWKDFGFFYKSDYWPGDRYGEIKVYEPYVCIFCKERKNILLATLEYNHTSLEAMTVNEEEVSKKYNIKDRVLLEDEINDFQLVNREALELAVKLKIGNVADSNNKKTVANVPTVLKM